MTSFLIILSLLLHGVTFFVIVTLYQKVQQFKSADADFDRKVKETEDLLDSYILELKDENEKFIQAMSSVNTEPTNTSVTESEEKTTTQKPTTLETMPTEKQETPDYVEEMSLEARVLKMYSQGLSVEHIAKSLGVGQTEVNLIIKFNKKIN